MIVVAIAWMYVVVMMAAAEAADSNGTLLGAAVTLLLYGVLPLSIVLYLMASPARGKARRRREEAARAAQNRSENRSASPDGGDRPAGDAVAPERKEP